MKVLRIYFKASKTVVNLYRLPEEVCTDRRLSTHNASCPVWMEKAKWSISNYSRGVGVGVIAKK